MSEDAKAFGPAACADCCPEGDYRCDAHELADLLEFCATPEIDTLLRVESEGGVLWSFDASSLRKAHEAIRARARAEGKAEGLEEAADEAYECCAARIRSRIPAAPEGTK